MTIEILSIKPRALRGLVPIGELKSLVAQRSIDELREIWAAQIDPIRRIDPKWAHTLDCWVELSLLQADVVTATLSLALLLDLIEIFVSNPVNKVAFQVLHPFWSLQNLEPDGIEPTVAAGIWQVPPPWIKGSRLVVDHNGYPIYVAESALQVFRHLPISDSASRQAALGVIQRYDCMRKDDFFTEIMKADDRINRERAKTLWAENAPKDWHKSGPKKTQLKRSN